MHFLFDMYACVMYVYDLCMYDIYAKICLISYLSLGRIFTCPSDLVCSRAIKAYFTYATNLSTLMYCRSKLSLCYRLRWTRVLWEKTLLMLLT